MLKRTMSFSEGFDTQTGTLESQLVCHGHTLMTCFLKEVGLVHTYRWCWPGGEPVVVWQLGLPLDQCGACMVAWTPEDLKKLDAVISKVRLHGLRHKARSSIVFVCSRRAPTASVLIECIALVWMSFVVELLMWAPAPWALYGLLVPRVSQLHVDGKRTCDFICARVCPCR